MTTLPVFRASGLDKLIRCHASVLLEEKAIFRAVQSITLDGTYIHHRIAKELITYYGAVSNEEQQDPEFPAAYQPTEVGWAIDYCLRLALDDAPEDWFLMVENHYAWQFDRFILSGHIDYLSMDPDCTEAYGKDWKTGYAWTDPAAQNWQVLGYIVLLHKAYPTLKKISFDVIQPRASRGDDSELERVSTVVVEGAELEQSATYLEQKLNEVLDDPYSLETGPKQCQYCRAKLICPGLKELRKRMKLKLTPEAIEKLQAEPDDSAMVELYVDSRTLEPLLEVVKALVKARLEKDRQLVADNGVSLTPNYTRGNTKITDLPEFYDRTEKLIGHERMRECFKPVVNDLKRQIAKHFGIPQKSKLKRDAAEVFTSEYHGITEQQSRMEVRING